MEHQGRHQPLVPESLFDRVQEVLRSRTKAGRSSGLTTTTSGQRFLRALRQPAPPDAGQGPRYLYFFCVGRQQRRSACPLPYLPAEDVERAVEEYYRSVRLPEDVQQSIRDGLKAELDQQRRQAAPEIA